MKLRPEYILIRSLRKTWNPNKAAVIADWCEERGLTAAARELRKGPSAKARGAIDSLCGCIGVSEGGTMHHWQLGWLPGYQPTPQEQRFLKKRAKREFFSKEMVERRRRQRMKLEKLDEI